MPTPAPSLINASRLETFQKYFDLSLALTSKQRAQVYQIRYRVYCEEFGYEPTSAFINQQEVDDFDNQSIHCLVTHKETGRPAGCVRVVMVKGDDMMPMEEHVGDSLDRPFFDKFSEHRDTICEISRLAVDTGFRRRHLDKQTRFGNVEITGFSESELRTFPLIALILMIGAGAAADSLGRTNCFAIMEPALPKLMGRSGINFRRVGTDFEFRGIRAPYYGNMEELINNASPEMRLYFNDIREKFATSLSTQSPNRESFKKMVSVNSHTRGSFGFPSLLDLIHYLDRTQGFFHHRQTELTSELGMS